jgi:2-hydroxychromene-2-carboxylate isomerase
MLECTGAHSIGEGRAMEKPRVRIYTDYKSPYALVANTRLCELEEKFDVELEWLPYTLACDHGHGGRAHAAFLA